ncbi:MAG: beta strand repeat-containing protein, partial [Dolichospermum sp.]
AVVTVAVAPASVTEDGSSNLVYTFTRTGSTTNTLTVNYTVGGTATLGTDYTGISTTGATKTLTFAAGSSTAIVTVDPTADTTFEYDETVVLTLTHGEDYSPSATSSATGTIANDETQVTLAVSPTSITEDGTPNLIYTFTRTGVTTNALTVNYTVGGTATIGTDYTGIATAGTTKTVTFAAGSSTATVTVDPTADTTVESDETVILTLASGTGYTIGTPAQTEQYASTVISFSSEWSEGSWGAVQILGQPNTLSYGASWAPEPANADGDLQADEFITVGFATPVYASGIEVRETYGNGFVRSIDLLSNQGTYYSVWSGIDTSMPGLPVDFRINFDQTSYLVVGARINVDIDHTSGWEEIDSVKLIGTTGAVTGTITNDDFPSITLAVSPTSITEDGTPNLIYTFTRTGVTTNALTVNYTVGGTATIGTDYTGIATAGTTKTVTFAAGSSTATVTVNPTADTTVESDETVILTLASGTGYTIGTSDAVTGTITNDDPFTGTPNADTLTGTNGADTLIGLAGNDTYTVNHVGDIVTEALNAGTDLVNAS